MLIASYSNDLDGSFSSRFILKQIEKKTLSVAMRDYLKCYLDSLSDNMRTILVYKEKQGVKIWIQSGYDIRETAISRYGNIETRYCSK